MQTPLTLAAFLVYCKSSGFIMQTCKNVDSQKQASPCLTPPNASTLTFFTSKTTVHLYRDNSLHVGRALA